MDALWNHRSMYFINTASQHKDQVKFDIDHAGKPRAIWCRYNVLDYFWTVEPMIVGLKVGTSIEETMTVRAPWINNALWTFLYRSCHLDLHKRDIQEWKYITRLSRFTRGRHFCQFNTGSKEMLWNDNQIQINTSNSPEGSHRNLSTDQHWKSHAYIIKLYWFNYVQTWYIVQTSKDAGGCDVCYAVAVLLDPTHHEEEIRAWKWTGICKDIQDMNMKTQRYGKTAQLAIQLAKCYVEDHSRCTYEEDADVGWERSFMTTKLDSLCLYLV